MRRMHRPGRWQSHLFLPHADLGPSVEENRHHRRTRHGREAGPDAARLHRGAGGAVRLLYSRDDDACPGAAGEKARRDRGRDPRASRAEPLPLRHAHANPQGSGTRNEIAAMNRREFLATSGGVVVGLALPAQVLAALPGDLEKTPLLDAWIGIAADGAITVFTGKAELGQGIKTALLQIAAEQLGVEPARITLVTADTARTPNE